MANKPDCYKCKHRGIVPGDAHSCCKHPDSGLGDMNLIEAMGKAFLGGLDCKLKVKGNPMGIRKGWFVFPANFDPTWLMECNGFEKKTEKKKQKS